MIPPAYPCVASRYVKKVIKICEWVKNEKSALNLLCIVYIGAGGYIVGKKLSTEFQSLLKI